MTLSSHFGTGKCALSYELFPPKTPAGDAALAANLEKLMAYRPDFVTCTYGAGGSTQTKTLDVCRSVKQQFDVPVASHLTVVGSTTGDLESYLREAWDAGVEYLVALRGDPPQGETTFQPVAGGLRFANELVELIRSLDMPFGIAVAGYPEVHQEATSPDADLANLKRKVDAGADIVITQLFYINDDFFRFRDRCVDAGINVPIVPGILPVTDLGQIQRITKLCKAQLPESFVKRLGERDDSQWQAEVGIEFATQQVQELLAAEVPGLHLYVLNKSQAALQVLQGVNWPQG